MKRFNPNAYGRPTIKTHYPPNSALDQNRILAQSHDQTYPQIQMSSSLAAEGNAENSCLFDADRPDANNSTIKDEANTSASGVQIRLHSTNRPWIPLNTTETSETLVHKSFDALSDRTNLVVSAGISTTPGEKSTTAAEQTEERISAIDYRQSTITAPKEPLSTFSSSAFENIANTVTASSSIRGKETTHDKNEMSSTSLANHKYNQPTSTDRTLNPQTNMEISKLQQARGEALKQIWLRNRGKERDQTTSLRDLDLARRPSPSTKIAVGSEIVPNEFNVAQKQIQLNPFIPASVAASVSVRSNGIEPKLGSGPNQSTKVAPNGQKAGRSCAMNGAPHIGRTNTVGAPDHANLEHKGPRTSLQPIEMDVISNAWGCSIPSNASEASNDSIRPLHSGKAVQKPHALLGWDGALQPPPADWDDRPHFDNDTPAFRDDFERWAYDIGQMTMKNNDNQFARIPRELLQYPQIVPDGISMIPMNMVVNSENAGRYGYIGKDAQDPLKHVQKLESNDFENWGKLDMSRPENQTIQHETTEALVANWVHNTQERRRIADAHMHEQELAAQAVLNYHPVAETSKPILSIYIRPACQIDLEQMAGIYNWYIANSPRPAETQPIEYEDEMDSRLRASRQAKLPLIVAIERNKRSAIPFDAEAEAEAWKNDSHTISNIDPRYGPMKAKEKIVGWASAQDFTAADYVERISAELEVYVDPAYRQLGVGNCLLDRLLEACDYGHRKRFDYPFHCAPELRHLFNSGGGRSIHKLVFLLRKWKTPRSKSTKAIMPKYEKANKQRKEDDLEDDYSIWIRKWLESWDFEVEGVLKGVGAKSGRYVDVVHLGRETSWHPAEGDIPEPVPRMY